MLTVQILPTVPLEQWSQQLTESQVTIATARALNKTARWLRTQVARETAKSLKLPVNKAKQGLMVLRANKQHLQAGIGLTKTAGVIKATQLGAARPTRQGVRTGQRFWSHAFTATMPSGHRGVFKRRGQARLPIQEMQLVVTGRMAKAMQMLADDKAAHYFEQTFAHELRYLARRT